MRVLRLTISIVLLLLLVVAFVFFGELSDTASAQFLDGAGNAAGTTGAAEDAGATSGGGPGGVSGDEATGAGAGGSESGAGSSAVSGAENGAAVTQSPNGGSSAPTPAATGDGAAGSGVGGNGAPGGQPGAGATGPTDPTSSPIPPDVEETPQEVVYTTIAIDDFYIHKGSLLLINHDNIFETPAYPDYIRINDFKNSSYRIADSTMELSYSIMDPLNDMMDAFYDETGLGTVTITSAYRTLEKQQAILNDYIALVGKNEATKWASPPGYSEHHSGMAFDLGVYTGGSVKSFTGTGKYAWFRQHAHEYGFILRYPPDKTDITRISSEPWHFRYVGYVHANIIRENDWCLEEYIEFIMEHPPEDGFITQLGSETYEIFFTRDNECNIRKGSSYVISGNNSDGFIITVKWPTEE